MSLEKLLIKTQAEFLDSSGVKREASEETRKNWPHKWFAALPSKAGLFQNIKNSNIWLTWNLTYN